MGLRLIDGGQKDPPSDGSSQDDGVDDALDNAATIIGVPVMPARAQTNVDTNPKGKMFDESSVEDALSMLSEDAKPKAEPPKQGIPPQLLQPSRMVVGAPLPGLPAERNNTMQGYQRGPGSGSTIPGSQQVPVVNTAQPRPTPAYGQPPQRPSEPTPAPYAANPAYGQPMPQPMPQPAPYPQPTPSPYGPSPSPYGPSPNPYMNQTGPYRPGPDPTATGPFHPGQYAGVQPGYGYPQQPVAPVMPAAPQSSGTKTLLIVIALVVVIGGGAIAFILMNAGGGDDTTAKVEPKTNPPNGSGVASAAVPVPVAPADAAAVQPPPPPPPPKTQTITVDLDSIDHPALESVTAPSKGQVATIAAANGKDVKAGDPLFTLKAKPANSNVAALQKKLADMKALAKDDPASYEGFVARAERDLELATMPIIVTVKANAAGTFTTKVKIGDEVAAGAALGSIGDGRSWTGIATVKGAEVTASWGCTIATPDNAHTAACKIATTEALQGGGGTRVTVEVSSTGTSWLDGLTHPRLVLEPPH